MDITITTEALEWVARLKKSQPGDATRQEFVQWMRRSPEHMEEYLAMAELDDLLRMAYS